MFKTWLRQVERFHEEIRELRRAHSVPRDIMSKEHYRLLMMKKRVQDICNVRKQHYELRRIVHETFVSDPIVQEQVKKQ